MRQLLTILAVALALTGVAKAQTTTRTVVINDSHYALIHLQTFNVVFQSYTWGRDLLHGAVMMPGERRILDFGDVTGACIYHIKVTTASGIANIYPNIDVCHTNSLLLADWR